MKTYADIAEGRETFNVTKAQEAQQEYCEERQVPNFVGNGRCWRCFCNVFDREERSDGTFSGISVERARTRHITGCCHCGASFCD